jgi:hypothetical protein
MLGFLTKFRGEFEKRVKPGLRPEPRPPAGEQPLVQIRSGH